MLFFSAKILSHFMHGCPQIEVCTIVLTAPFCAFHIKWLVSGCTHERGG